MPKTTIDKAMARYNRMQAMTPEQLERYEELKQESRDAQCCPDNYDGDDE